MTKFKVWDLKNKKWLTSNCGKFVIDQDGKLWFKELLPLSVAQLEEIFDYEIVWYTGLPDKKGKKIYKGDIVGNYATHGIVIYEDGMFTLSMSAKKSFGHRQPLCYLDGLEKIGDIYNNPKLIREANL